MLDVGKLVNVPDGGNPHRWYSPGNVETVADAITADLSRLDPDDATYFTSRRRIFEDTALAECHHLIDDIRASYSGTPVGASESIFAPLAQALGLDLLTPASFLKAISEGTDPSAADKAEIDAQIAGKYRPIQTAEPVPDTMVRPSTPNALDHRLYRARIPLRDTEDSLEPHRTLAGSARPDASNPRLLGVRRRRPVC